VVDFIEMFGEPDQVDSKWKIKVNVGLEKGIE
jgi:hypothetical protein